MPPTAYHVSRAQLVVAVALVAILGALSISNAIYVTQVSRSEEHAAKAALEAAQAASHAETAANLARAIAEEKNARLISTCELLNQQAHQVVADTERNDIYFANVVSPPDQRTKQEQDFITLVIASHLNQVKKAHPLRDCSPKALGIKPLPPAIVPGSVTPNTQPASHVTPTAGGIGRGPGVRGTTPTTVRVPPTSSPPTTACCTTTTTTMPAVVCIHPPAHKCRHQAKEGQ